MVFHYSCLIWRHLCLAKWLYVDILSYVNICDIVVLGEYLVFLLLDLIFIKVHAIAIDVAVEGVDLVANAALIKWLSVYIPLF